MLSMVPVFYRTVFIATGRSLQKFLKAAAPGTWPAAEISSSGQEENQDIACHSSTSPSNLVHVNSRVLKALRATIPNSARMSQLRAAFLAQWIAVGQSVRPKLPIGACILLKDACRLGQRVTQMRMLQES